MFQRFEEGKATATEQVWCRYFSATEERHHFSVLGECWISLSNWSAGLDCVTRREDTRCARHF